MNHIILLLCIITTIGCTSSNNPSDVPVAPQSSSTISSSVVSSKAASSSYVYNDVSLPAYFNKSITGADLTLGTVLASNNIYTRYTITYTANNLTISGIMNIPNGDGPYPLLILNHGYIDPAVYTNGRGLKREQDYFARNGYAVLHPDYRNHAASGKDEQNDINFRLGYIIDSIAAIKAVQNSDLTQIDTQNVGMLGHSMGGGVTLGSLVVDPSLVDAAVLFAPVSGYAEKNYEQWTVNRPETQAAVVEAYGTASTNPEFWKNVSPAYFYNRVTAPVQIHHGTSDADVPVSWSDQLQQDLEQANVQSEYYVYQNAPHEFISDWPVVMQRSLDFYNQHLKDN